MFCTNYYALPSLKNSLTDWLIDLLMEKQACICMEYLSIEMTCTQKKRKKKEKKQTTTTPSQKNLCTHVGMCTYLAWISSFSNNWAGSLFSNLHIESIEWLQSYSKCIFMNRGNTSLSFRDGWWQIQSTYRVDDHTQQPEISPNQQLVDTHFSTLLLSLFSSKEFFTVSSSSKMFTRAQNIPWLKK